MEVYSAVGHSGQYDYQVLGYRKLRFRLRMCFASYAGVICEGAVRTEIDE